MDWFAQIDAYCERTDAGYWAEPVNAVTNVAFLAVAMWLWPRTAGAARLLCGNLFAIGLGSWLFHTEAAVWAAVLDTVPIVLFILIYLFLVHRYVLDLDLLPSIGLTATFMPFALIVTFLLGQMPFFAISSFYWSVPILLMIYASQIEGEVRRGFWIGAALLALSITWRSLDLRLCEAWPIGTHFIWHLLNALMLGWMIHVYERHRLATAPHEG